MYSKVPHLSFNSQQGPPLSSLCGYAWLDLLPDLRGNCPLHAT
jgi:hypothetical protein